MEEILANLKKLAANQRNPKANQDVVNAVALFREKLPEKATEAEIAQLEAALLKVLKVNGGNLSPACARFVGVNLVSVYELEKTHRFWNLISATTEAPTPALLWAISHVIKKQGHHSKSSLGNLTQQLCTLKEPLVFPALVTLRSVFKVCGVNMMNKSAPSAFGYAKSHVYKEHEPTQLAALRLLEILVGYPSVPVKKIVSLAESVFKYCKSMYANEECGHLVALCAALPFMKTKHEEGGEKVLNDFALQEKHKPGESTLTNSFSVLKKFKDKFSVIFNRFLDLLEPEFIFKNSKELITFARSMSVADQGKVMAFFARDVRADILDGLLAMNPPPFNLVRTMVFDAKSTRRVAELALPRICGQVPEEKTGACQFFVAVTNSYPEIAMEYLIPSLNFLAEPEKDDPLVYVGRAAIVALVLSTIDNRQRVIQAQEPVLRKFIEYVKSSKKIDVAKLQAYFMVLSTLPDDFVDVDFAKAQFTRMIDMFKKLAAADDKNRKVPVSLMEYIAIFLSIHPTIPNGIKMIESLIPLTQYFSNVMILALAQLTTQLPFSAAVHANLTWLFTNRLFASGFSLPFIRRKIPGLMRLQEEPFVRGKVPALSKNPTFIVEEYVFSAKLAELMPTVVGKLSDNDFKKFTQMCMKNIAKVPAAMSMLAIYQSGSAVMRRLPANFHEQMLKSLASDSIIRTQILAECIVHHTLIHPEALDTVLAYIQKNKTPASCMLDASLARNMKMPEKTILAFLKRAAEYVKIPQLVDFVLHAVAELYVAKSVQMVGLGVGDEQCEFFLSLLDNPGSQSPFTLSLIGSGFERLVPIILPFLSMESTSSLVKNIMNGLRLNPTPFSNVIFNYVYRAIIAFAPDIAQKYPIRYPESPSAHSEQKLAVCGSLTDLAKLQHLNDLFDLVPALFVLLQRTKDERAAKLIVTIAKSMEDRPFDPKRMTSWYKLAKQILSGNAMPGFGEATVEPNTFVKTCALQIIHALLPLLAKREPLLTDCLDDLMTSTIRAIETEKRELHALAYPILETVVASFRYTKTEEGGTRLLELYESQFSIASRFSFPNSVDLSSEFLVAYLEFYFDDFAKNEQGFMMLLDAYVSGLTKVADKDSGFFAVASKLCVLARASDVLFEHLTPFLVNLTPLFCQLVLDSVKLRSTNNDWAEISKYRNKISPFYANMLPSFVWLQKVFPTDPVIIDTPTMVSFFILEMTISSESWRVRAGFAAISTVLRYFAQEVDFKFFDLIVSACGDAARKSGNLLKPLIPDFLLYAAKMIQKSEEYYNIWHTLTAILFMHDNECNAEALALLLKCAPNTDLIASFGDLIVRGLVKKNYSEDEGIALMTVLYDMDPQAIPVLVRSLCPFDNRIDDFVKFKMTAIRRALLRCNTRVSIDKIASFCVNNFRKGGMELVAQILVRRAELGIELLARGAANEALLTVNDSLDEAKVSMKFFSLVLVRMKNEPVKEDVAFEIAKCACSVIVKWAGDRKRGKEIASDAIRVLKDCDIVAPGSSKKAFGELSDEDKESCIVTLGKFKAIANKAPRKLALKKFSTATRKKDDGGDGWQDLEVDE